MLSSATVTSDGNQAESQSQDVISDHGSFVDSDDSFDSESVASVQDVVLDEDQALDVCKDSEKNR